MLVLTSLIMVAGLLVVVCLVLVKLIWDLLQASVHDSPTIPENPGNSADLEGPSLRAVGQRDVPAVCRQVESQTPGL
jgi:hypothetical protein